MRSEPGKRDEFFATITSDHRVETAHAGFQHLRDLYQATVTFLMAVIVIVLLEEIDIDQKHREIMLGLDPLIPQLTQPAVDCPTIFKARQRIGVGKPQKRFAAIFRLLLLHLGFDGVEEHMVALAVKTQVHVGREGEASEVKGTKGNQVIDIFMEIAQRDEISPRIRLTRSATA